MKESNLELKWAARSPIMTVCNDHLGAFLRSLEISIKARLGAMLCSKELGHECDLDFNSIKEMLTDLGRDAEGDLASLTYSLLDKLNSFKDPDTDGDGVVEAYDALCEAYA